MKYTSSLHVDSNVQTAAVRFAAEIAGTVSRWLCKAIYAMRARPRKPRSPYRMRGEELLHGPLADECRRARWF